jgi:hypothetical protein
MEWRLSEHVAATDVGDDLVFLDLHSDQYSCLRGQAELRLDGRRLTGAPNRAVSSLIEAGFLVAAPAAEAGPQRLPPPDATRDGISLPAARVSVRELIDFALCWVEATVRFPGRSLLALHGQARDNGSNPPSPDLEATARRLAVFETLMPWVPFPGACLYRSYLLLRFMQRGGCDAGWTIGVRTWPFEAHCWLQIGDVALDDRCERLVRYRPLLAI